MKTPEGLRVRVATPCKARWDEMGGDERVRFCGECRKNVYNLSVMTRDEAEALVMDAESEPCVTFFQRSDGTVLTDDCPVGVASFRRKVARGVAAAGVLTLGTFGATAVLATPRLDLVTDFIDAPSKSLESHGGVAGWLSALWRGERCTLDAPAKGLTVTKGMRMFPGGK